MRYSEQEREQIAAEYDEYAAGCARTADDLASRGYDIAAEVHRDQATQCRQIAEAARTSSDELNHQFTDEHNTI
ncbi:hypothetical protein [Streptomyces sp. NRRL F-5630]|uniref:hypothetical protein n=1 Tax=Streptomyces sp. NRRL F-5630 TaxID=1463864 RepID=UPI003D74CE39